MGISHFSFSPYPNSLLFTFFCLFNFIFLETTASESSTEDLDEEVQKLLNAAARDCVVQDRNSFVAFQAQTGVEVCVFQAWKTVHYICPWIGIFFSMVELALLNKSCAIYN